jgi:subtilisin family serine protease
MFHDLTDQAAFGRVMLVSAMANEPKTTIPSEFSSVFSTAAIAGDDPLELRYNAAGPAEWGARGIDVEVAWADGSTITATGNSFAAPHVAGLIALVLEKHPGLTPFQVKTVLAGIAADGAGLASAGGMADVAGCGGTREARRPATDDTPKVPQS